MSKEGMENFEGYLDFVETSPGSVVEGIVTRINPSEGVYVDFQAKEEGFIPNSELVFSPEKYQVGQKLTVQVLKINDEEGSAVLSEKRPFLRLIRSKLRDAYEKGELVKGKIVGAVTSGYQVSLYGVLNAFLPGSHSLLKKDSPIPQEELDFAILELEFGRKRQRIVVSRKLVLDKKRKEFFLSHKVGDVVEGVVEKVDESHALINLGPVSAILPKSEVSYDARLSPTDVLKRRERVKAKIIEMDEASFRVVVSLKAMEPDPWEKVIEKYPVGKIVQGTVRNIAPFGLFVNLEPGIDGLVRISEIFWGNKKVDLHRYFKVGQVIQVEVVEVDSTAKKIGLSYKRAQGDPWENILDRFKEGDVVEGSILKVVPTGLIVELQDGVSGFAPRSELSWEKVKDPTQLFRDGQKIKVKILSIDEKQRRMRLSVRQLTTDPWEEVMTKLSEDSEVKARVQSKVNSGYVVKLTDFNVEGFMPSSHASTDFKEGDEIEVLVLRIVPERRKILVSQKKLEEKRAYEEYKKKTQTSGLGNTLGDRLKK